jgi:hypothetical protein
MMDWDLLRARLDMPYQPGSWFLLPEAQLGFAPQKLGRRPVMLGIPAGTGPIGSGCVRTTTWCRTGLRHPPHPRDGDHPICGINKRGWIVVKVPVNFDQALLHQVSYICTEPDGGVVARVVKACS